MRVGQVCSLIMKLDLPFSHKVTEDQVKRLHHELSQRNLLTEREFKSCW